MLSKYSRIELLFTFLVLVSMAFSVQAATCTSPTWTAESTQTSACIYGTSNPKEADVRNQFPSAEQVDMVTGIDDGAVEVKDGLPALFSVNLDPGYSWGQLPNGGTWAIDSKFWNIFESAAITIHGGGSSAIFIVNPGSLNGVWSIDGPKGTGGGLSNIKLWGVNRVPEPSVLALFSIGFVGLVYIRRKRTK